MKSKQKSALRSVTLAALALSSFITAATVWASGSHAGSGDDQAIGQPGLAARINRTVTVDMSDNMRFTPASLQVGQGETVRFIVKNSGRIKHEFVLGTVGALKAHYEQMKKFPGMEHADPNMVTVAPGKTGEVVWQFSKAGKVDFACLQPGHYDAGMKGFVNVAAAGETAVPGKANKGDGHGHGH